MHIVIITTVAQIVQHLLAQMPTPLVNCTVNDALVHFMSNFL